MTGQRDLAHVLEREIVEISRAGNRVLVAETQTLFTSRSSPISTLTEARGEVPSRQWSTRRSEVGRRFSRSERPAISFWTRRYARRSRERVAGV